MKSTLSIEVYKLVFPKSGFHGYAWFGVHSINHRENDAREVRRESKPSLQELIEQWTSYFGGELRDDECKIQITSPPNLVVGGTFMYNKGFYAHIQLEAEEMLTILRYLQSYKDQPWVGRIPEELTTRPNADFPEPDRLYRFFTYPDKKRDTVIVAMQEKS